MGYENVGWTEDENERVYVLQNSAYKIQRVGIAKAIKVIQDIGMPEKKICRVVVLDNNVPQVSLCYTPEENDTVQQVQPRDWDISYELGDTWSKARKVKRKNSSLFKVDVLVYPYLYFKNVIITQIYQVCLEMSPAIEVSLWKGSKLTAQVTIPVYNDGYPGAMENIRPGYLTLEQRVRLPHNVFMKAVVGIFDMSCYGVELSAFHPLKWDNRFSLEGKFGLVGNGYFYDFNTFKYNGNTQYYWSVGGNFYYPQWNTQLKLRAERYLLEDLGVRGELIRHFKYTSIGFYLAVSDEARSNGGFRVTIALPPYGKYKRKGYIPRLSTSLSSGITYNAGNEQNYYLMPYSTAYGNSMIEQNQFNPYFIETEFN